MPKKLISVWLVVALFSIFIYALPARAVTGDFSLSYAGQPGPLFNETNFAPLSSVTKQISISNNTSLTQKFALNLQNLLGTPDNRLAQVLVLEISRAGHVLYTKHLSDLADKETFLENIPGSATFIYDLKVTMDDVGNDYQQISTVFDLIWGFIGTDAVGGGSDDDSEKILGAATSPEVSASTDMDVNELPQTGQNAFLSLIMAFLMILASAAIFTGLRFIQVKLKQR